MDRLEESADLLETKHDLGWELNIDLEEGIELLFNWVKVKRISFRRQLHNAVR